MVYLGLFLLPAGLPLLLVFSVPSSIFTLVRGLPLGLVSGCCPLKLPIPNISAGLTFLSEPEKWVRKKSIFNLANLNPNKRKAS